MLQGIDKCVNRDTFSLNVTEKPNIQSVTNLKYYCSDASLIFEYQLKTTFGIIYFFDIVVVPPSTAAGEAYLHGYDSATAVANGSVPDYVHPMNWTVNSKPFSVSETLSKYGIPFMNGLYMVVSNTMLTLTKSTTTGVKLQVLYL